MSERIEIPEANLRNIATFSEEPNDALIQEIKNHVRQTSSPHTWRGHSHTKPEKGAFVVYIEEFDVPAPDTIERVAPCPCCNPNHPQYKNKGKIAWFPHEGVIRIIGPQCFKAINASGHDEALIDLRRRKKRREEIATILRHSAGLDGLIAALDEALPIAEDLDTFMREINRVIDGELQLQLWREVKGGDLMVAETRQVPFQKTDGTIGTRKEDFRVAFARIRGNAMIDRCGQPAIGKLGPLRAGLAQVAKRIGEVAALDDLSDAERESMAGQLVKGRQVAEEVLSAMLARQVFLTSDAIETLHSWGQHPNAPMKFSIERRGHGVNLSSPRRGMMSLRPIRVEIGESAIKPIPVLPALGEPRS